MEPIQRTSFWQRFKLRRKKRSKTNKLEAPAVPTADTLQAQGPRDGSVPNLTFAPLPQQAATVKALTVPALSEDDAQLKEVTTILDTLHRERQQLQEALTRSRSNRLAAEARAAKAVAANNEELATLELIDVKRAVDTEEKVVRRYKQCSAQVDRWTQRMEELRTAKFDCQASRLMGDVNKSLQASRNEAAKNYVDAEAEYVEAEYEVPTLSESDDAWIQERLKAMQTKAGSGPAPVAKPVSVAAPAPAVAPAPGAVPAQAPAVVRPGAFVPKPVFQQDTAPAPQSARVAFAE